MRANNLYAHQSPERALAKLGVYYFEKTSSWVWMSCNGIRFERTSSGGLLVRGPSSEDIHHGFVKMY